MSSRGGEVPPGAETAELEGRKAFAWKRNALRHSFISYRVAQVQDVAKASLEAGNSPRMVFSNYRELVPAADADKWFGITPEAWSARERAIWVQESEPRHHQEMESYWLPKPWTDPVIVVEGDDGMFFEPG